MARKKSSGPAHSNGTGKPVASRDVEWGGFIEVRLSDEEKDQFGVWYAENASGVWTEFVELLAESFKFGLSYDHDGDYYLATLTAHGVEVMGLPSRYCMTARAPVWEKAVALLLYKHIVVARRDWGNYKPRQMRFENFG